MKKNRKLDKIGDVYVDITQKYLKADREHRAAAEKHHTEQSPATENDMLRAAALANFYGGKLEGFMMALALK